MKKVIYFALVVLSVLCAVFGCSNNIDLKELIETDVKINNNPKFSLTLEATTGGTVSPSGAVEVAEEVPASISATAEDSYAFKEWQVTSGVKSATLNASSRANENSVTILGSDVAILAVFVRQPVVITTFPEDDGVARNMPVRIVFSKAVDEESITADTIQVFDNLLNSQIEGRYVVTGSEVMFYADDPSLEQTEQGLYLWKSNRHYQVYVRQEVSDTDGITLLEETSWFFQTGTEIDNTAPVINSFTVESLSGRTAYTDDQSVHLSFDAEDESLIPIRAIKYWNLTESEPADVDLVEEVVDTDGYIDFELLSGDSIKQINLKVYDMVGNHSEATTSITLDTKLPNVTMHNLIDPEADSDGFANTRNLSFQLTGTDENGVESLGWVADDSGGDISWNDYTTDPVDFMLPDADGNHVIYLAVRDVAGNTSIAADNFESIILDRSAPSGTVQIKGGAGWAGANDRNVAITLSCSDLTLDDGDDIALSFEVESVSFTNPAAARIYPGSTSSVDFIDVDLFPDPHSPTSGEVVTVTVRLTDRFGYSREVTDTIRLDFTAPTASFYIKSLDEKSENSTTVCKPEYPNGPYVQLVIVKEDDGGSGLADYCYETSDSGGYTSWILDSDTTEYRNIYFADKWGTKTVNLIVRDGAGNESIEYSNSIKNYWRAYLWHDRVWVESDSEFAGKGEMYWDYDLRYLTSPGGSDYYAANDIFRLEWNKNIPTDSGNFIEESSFSGTADYTYNYYRETPPYSLRVQGYLREHDTDSAIDVSKIGKKDWTVGDTEGNYLYLYTDSRSQMDTGDPRGYIRFRVWEND